MTRFLLDDQIASQPEAVRDALRRTEPPQLDPERPLVFTGIGTSLHACRVAAAWTAEITEGRLRPHAVETHEFALRGGIQAGDQIVVVSHRGTKRFPTALLDRAKAVGASSVTVTGFGAERVAGDVVLRTCADETSMTHTVSYVSALAVLGRLIARLAGKRGEALTRALESAPEAQERTLALPAPVRAAEQVHEREPILVTGFGLDAITAQETALKIKEAAYAWSEGMSVEQALHGPPAAYDGRRAAITITPPHDDGERTAQLRGLLQEIGVTALTCGDADEDLPFAPVHPLARPLVAVIPLQRLSAEMARLRGTNPDKIRTDAEPWASAMRRVRL